MRLLLAQFTRFGLVGAVGLVVDLGVFNLLRATVLSPEQLHEGPVLAKVVSTTLAIVCNWIGNRHWTFRQHRGRRLAREGVQFGLVSVGGMLIGLGCLWVSHYLLGFTSILADNIASNVIGLALGTAFRFTLYKVWVFRPRGGEDGRGDDDPGRPELSSDPSRPSTTTRSGRSRSAAPAVSGTGSVPVVAAPRPD